MSRSLVSLPEELVARILDLVLAPTPRPPSRHRIAPLLVSRQFLRIASPLFYHTLSFHSLRQARQALEALTHHPALADDVRQIVFAGIWHAGAGVLALCDYVQDLDICLDGGPGQLVGPNDASVEAFCCALEQRRTIKHLTIRKDPAVYLTHPRPLYILQRLSQAVHHWSHLETVHIAFRMSASLATMLFAHALGVAPRLRSVRAELPAVWNNFLLVVSTNPCLEKITLYAEPTPGPMQCSRPNPTMGSAAINGGCVCNDIEHAILGTGLYMMEAKKHARFSELVKAGTSIIRKRAHTTIATLSTPVGAIRAKEVAVELLAHRDSLDATVTHALTVSRHAHTQDI